MKRGFCRTDRLLTLRVKGRPLPERPAARVIARRTDQVAVHLTFTGAGCLRINGALSVVDDNGFRSPPTRHGNCPQYIRQPTAERTVVPDAGLHAVASTHCRKLKTMPGAGVVPTHSSWVPLPHPSAAQTSHRWRSQRIRARWKTASCGGRTIPATTCSTA